MGGTSTHANPGASARVASVLAVLAVVAVLGTALAGVTAYVGRDSDAAPAAPRREHAFAGGQLVVGDRADNAVFEVPSRRHGWTVQDSDVALFYVDRDGRPAVEVEGAAVFRDGYCPRQDNSNRGFVGFTRSVRGMTTRQANVELSRDWIEAISLDEDLEPAGPHSPLRTGPLTLGDGTPAVQTTSRVTLTGPGPGPCSSPAVEFAMVSFETGAAVANLVLVRDAGTSGTRSDELADELADQILRTARRVPR